MAYPLADAEIRFDSGELGDAGPPTAGRVEEQFAGDARAAPRGVRTADDGTLELQILLVPAP